MLEKIRYKILGSLLVVLVLFILLAWMTLRYVEQPSFVKVEQTNAADQLERVQNIISSERLNLESWVTDWGYWDDTWEFVAGTNYSYHEDNLAGDYLGSLGLSFAVYLDRDLNVFWSEAYRSKDGGGLPLNRVLSEEYFTQQPSLLPESREAVVSGFIETKSGPAIVASHSILKSSGYGPAQGYLVFGKLLDATNLSKIDQQLVTRIDLLSVDPGQLDQDHLRALDELADLRKPHAIVTRDEHIFALAMLRDLSDRPIGMLRIRLERDITRLGKSTMQKSISLLLVAALLIMVLLWVLLKRMVITPTERLTRLVEITRKEMLKSGSQPNLKETIEALRLWRDTMSSSARRDEFGKLVHSFELFNESLQRADANSESDTNHEVQASIPDDSKEPHPD